MERRIFLYQKEVEKIFNHIENRKGTLNMEKGCPIQYITKDKDGCEIRYFDAVICGRNVDIYVFINEEEGYIEVDKSTIFYDIVQEGSR